MSKDLEKTIGNEKINAFNYQNLNLNSGLLLIPGYNKKSYLSVDDQVEVEPHPFVFFKNKNQLGQNKGYLSPLTSIKKWSFFNYKPWTCQCHHKYKDILIKKNKFLLFDIRKSKITKKPSLMKFTQEYEVDDLVLKKLLVMVLLKLWERILKTIS